MPTLMRCGTEVLGHLMKDAVYPQEPLADPLMVVYGFQVKADLEDPWAWVMYSAYGEVVRAGRVAL